MAATAQRNIDGNTKLINPSMRIESIIPKKTTSKIKEVGDDVSHGSRTKALKQNTEAMENIGYVHCIVKRVGPSLKRKKLCSLKKESNRLSDVYRRHMMKEWQEPRQEQFKTLWESACDEVNVIGKIKGKYMKIDYKHAAEKTNQFVFESLTQYHPTLNNIVDGNYIPPIKIEMNIGGKKQSILYV